LILKKPIPSLPPTLALAGLKITRLETPTEGYVNEWQSLTFEAHVESDTFQPGIGIAYVDGPADSIKVKAAGGEYEIPKGWFLAVYESGVTEPACASLAWPTPSGLLYPSVGVYTLRFLAGYVKDKTFYYTDYKDLGFKCQEKPPAEKPKEWWEQPWLFGIPVWQWIALGGGIGVIAIVAGVVAYEEREREMLYTLMLARR
jgi:hypothetical protein